MSAKFKNLSLQFLQIALCIFLASFGLNAFLIPNDFLDGGVTGIAILLHSILGLDTALFLIIVSLPFLIVGYFTVSKSILVKSIFSILALSFIIEVESFPVITSDKLLNALFGGGLLGAGIGLAIRKGTVLDGSELLGVYLNNKFGISVGKIVLLFNVILFSIAAFFLPIENILYSILTFMVTAKVIDLMIAGFEDYIGMMIISEKNNDIEKTIKQQLGVGMIILKADRGYGKKGIKEDYSIIKTVINRIDIRKLEEIINQIDSEAFVLEYDVNNIKGGMLQKYFS
jgi:uncharacterized membrane-anchored protein YitT (DUF2179 family)